MRLATLRLGTKEVAAIVMETGLIPVEVISNELNKNWSNDLLTIISSGQIDEMKEWHLSGGVSELIGLQKHVVGFGDVDYAPLYRYPGKIWGYWFKLCARA